MKKSNQDIILWIFRILVSGLFLLSAYGKFFPLESALHVFAKQIVGLGIADWCIAPLLARAIVGFEIFLGIAILQNNFLRNVIVPSTFLLLLVFCIHLSWVFYTSGNVGSCGCFGELIPMPPLEAIVKNLLTMAMLVYIFLKVKKKKNDNFLVPAVIFLIVYLVILILQPPKFNCNTVEASQEIVSDTIVAEVDSVLVADTVIDESGNEIITEMKKVVENQNVIEGRKKVNSIFTKYTQFNTGAVDLNEGKKIVCLYSFDCEHCQESSKLLLELKNNHNNFPPVYMLAFGEESQSTDFFKGAGGHIPYVVVEPQEFFQLLGEADYPPRIVVMDNGNFLADFMNFEHLDTTAVMRAVRR